MKIELRNELDKTRKELKKRDEIIKRKKEEENNQEEILHIYKNKVDQTNETKLMLSKELLRQKEFYEKQMEEMQSNRCILQ